MTWSSISTRRDGQARAAQVFGHLEADEAAAHHDGALQMRLRDERADAVGVLDGPERLHARGVDAGDRRAHGRGAGGEHERVVGKGIFLARLERLTATVLAARSMETASLRTRTSTRNFFFMASGVCSSSAGARG
jgi:hypothetical protein